MNIRKKGKWASGETKYVIEENGKYIETLPPVQELLARLRLDSTSCSNGENIPKPSQNISESSHNINYANQENETVMRKLTKEEIDKLWEMTK